MARRSDAAAHLWALRGDPARLSDREFLADIAGSGVIKSVYVQANWAKDRFEDEVAYVQEAADGTGFPQAIVGYSDFLVPDVDRSSTG